MESQVSPLKASEIKVIHVQVNDDIPIRIVLPIHQRLIEIREKLSTNPEIRIGNNTSFTNLKERNSFTKIQQEDEDKYCLSDVLGNNEKLKIIGEIEPDWAMIEKNCRISYGIHFTESGPLPAPEKAFEITEFPESILACPDTIDKMVFCKTENDHFFVKNSISNLKSNAKLPWSLISATFDGTRKTQFGNRVNNSEATTYYISKRIKARISINQSKIKATQKFLDAIDEALESPDQREALKEVIDTFGQFWCKRIGIGGSIIYVQKSETNLNENVRACGQSIEVTSEFKNSIGLGGKVIKDQKSNRMNTLNSAYSYFNIRGGLEEYYHERGMCGWIRSLTDYKTWKVAEYSDVHSIFDILDDERKEKIATALKKRITHSDVEKVDFIMDISTRKPHIYEFPKEVNISNTDQIFVTEMTDQETESGFALRVHYINENRPPVILIHRLGKLKSRKKYVDFSVKLGWIIVGTSLILNLLEKNSAQPAFESDEASIIVNNNQLSASVLSQDLNQTNTSLLATCVTRSKSSQDNPSKSEYIMGTYFYNKNGTVGARAFCYDRDMKPCHQIENTNLSINHSLISGQSKLLFGHASICKKRLNDRKIFSKRYKIYFTKYPQLISLEASSSNLEIISSSSNTQSTQSSINNPIFVSLVLDECSTKCIHGFFTITPNYAMFWSLNNSITKREQVTYFRAPSKDDSEYKV
ncbi:6290_t:CDS:2 [Ambispora gerdemannii]|uniref:6290_t:CDS:1 n=1 Tax=Ambispora gerdemannii TaxID=144530 RepID=A0A9N9BKT0_9GLOM|nr:6290_t:CDS:2 [Ambispora gerdemannii]